jgi:hypothetical protein
LDGRTAYEAWTGSAPAAHVKVRNPNLKKLEDKSRRMIFVGYELGSAAYKCYDPISKRVHVSRDHYKKFDLL